MIVVISITDFSCLYLSHKVALGYLTVVLDAFVDDLLHGFLDDVDPAIGEEHGGIRVFRDSLDEVAVDGELITTKVSEDDHGRSPFLGISDFDFFPWGRLAQV